jgi:hypothetical protein
MRDSEMSERCRHLVLTGIVMLAMSVWLLPVCSDPSGVLVGYLQVRGESIPLNPREISAVWTFELRLILSGVAAFAFARLIGRRSVVGRRLASAAGAASILAGIVLLLTTQSSPLGPFVYAF